MKLLNLEERMEKVKLQIIRDYKKGKIEKEKGMKKIIWIYIERE